MAILTSTPSNLTITLSRNSSSANGNITWTLPSIPTGTIINSCKLTGTATASNKNISSITINGQSITVSTTGTEFTIDLGTDITINSVVATATKSRNSSYNVNFTNMTYTVDYSIGTKYTVIFKNYDGTMLSTQEVIQGNAAIAPEEPSRDGYTFTGWDIDFSNVTSDLVVTAQYKYGVSIKENYYVSNVGTDEEDYVFFNSRDISFMDDLSVVYDGLKNDDNKCLSLASRYNNGGTDCCIVAYFKIQGIKNIEKISSATLIINAKVDSGDYEGTTSLMINGNYRNTYILEEGTSIRKFDVTDKITNNTLDFTICAEYISTYGMNYYEIVGIDSIRLDIEYDDGSSSVINNVKIGEESIKNLYLGKTNIKKIYLGDKKII